MLLNNLAFILNFYIIYNDFIQTLTGGFDASYKGVQAGSTKVTYNNDDDKLQESSVYFSDPIRQVYSTGLISFTIRAKDGNCGWNWSTNSGCDD